MELTEQIDNTKELDYIRKLAMYFQMLGISCDYVTRNEGKECVIIFSSIPFIKTFLQKNSGCNPFFYSEGHDKLIEIPLMVKTSDIHEFSQYNIFLEILDYSELTDEEMDRYGILKNARLRVDFSPFNFFKDGFDKSDQKEILKQVESALTEELEHKNLYTLDRANSLTDNMAGKFIYLMDSLKKHDPKDYDSVLERSSYNFSAERLKNKALQARQK